MSSTDIERHHEAMPVAPLAQQMQYAEAVAQAGLLPPAFQRQPANVLIALEAARALDESPWTVMQEMAVINGSPSFSAKFMRTRVRKAGHRLREYFADGVATCIIIRADDPDFEHRATWDEAKAKKHGYWGKGHWAKNPQLMLQNRALSECVREACYEVMGGVAYTSDEIADFAPEHHEPAAPRTSARVDWSPITEPMKTLGMDKEAVLAVATDLLGREVMTLSGLSQDEVDKVGMALLESKQTVDAEVVDEATGEVQDAFPEPADPAAGADPWAEGGAA